ncbi:hypothetical protein P5673_018340 [Acropora cervicornis]|uniref:Uncharacterized protein n=1 Tax=Acropora cervicornis TaxID=6130 RepID=A0AAD9V2T9_ACRCE|nr:hypothetical protein P5673_018340 [Acropora cervicornis]
MEVRKKGGLVKAWPVSYMNSSYGTPPASNFSFKTSTSLGDEKPSSTWQRHKYPVQLRASLDLTYSGLQFHGP